MPFTEPVSHSLLKPLLNLMILLYVVLTISILISQEPPAYFENLRDFVEKPDYSILCYPITSAEYTSRTANA